MAVPIAMLKDKINRWIFTVIFGIIVVTFIVSLLLLGAFIVISVGQGIE